jgi:hypothetical protein
MRGGVLTILLLTATTALAQVPVARVADDARVIDRVAEVGGKRDLPTDLLRRIVNEDIDLLRGRRTDGSYQYAGYERMEANRTSESFSVEPRSNDQLTKLEIRGANVYRLILESPKRRMVVTQNRRVWIDHVEVDSIPQGSTVAKNETIKVGAWLDPDATKPIDFSQIARSATVRVYAKADPEAGYGNIVLTLVEARVFDNPDSPYADAVESEKAILRALDHDDVGSIRSMASRIAQELGAKPAAATVEVAAPPIAPVAAAPATLNELQNIEDLLTGTETERRQGVDKLHQLIRRLRNP